MRLGGSHGFAAAAIEYREDFLVDLVFVVVRVPLPNASRRQFAQRVAEIGHDFSAVSLPCCAIEFNVNSCHARGRIKSMRHPANLTRGRDRATSVRGNGCTGFPSRSQANGHAAHLSARLHVPCPERRAGCRENAAARPSDVQPA